MASSGVQEGWRIQNMAGNRDAGQWLKGFLNQYVEG